MRTLLTLCMLLLLACGEILAPPTGDLPQADAGSANTASDDSRAEMTSGVSREDAGEVDAGCRPHDHDDGFGHTFVSCTEARWGAEARALAVQACSVFLAATNTKASSRCFGADEGACRGTIATFYAPSVRYVAWSFDTPLPGRIVFDEDAGSACPAESTERSWY